MKNRVAGAQSKVFDQQWAFDRSSRVDPAVFQHLVEIRSAGITITDTVAQIAEDAHARSVIERQLIVLFAGLIVLERRYELQNARRGALFPKCSDLLNGHAQIDSIRRELRRVVERSPDLDRLYNRQLAALEQSAHAVLADSGFLERPHRPATNKAKEQQQTRDYPPASLHQQTNQDRQPQNGRWDHPHAN